MINNQIPRTMVTAHPFDENIPNVDYVINQINDYLIKNNQDKIFIDLLNEYKINLFEDKVNSPSKHDLILLLDNMTKKGYLIKEEHGILNSCPLCDTISLKAQCQECGSENVSPERRMIHTSCGHLNDYDKFVTTDGLRCPGCGHRNSDVLNGVNEYRICDITHNCDDCGSEYKHHKIDKRHSCPKCNTKSKVKNMKMHHMLVYKNSI
jgi:DNA-directed RNA polymerase subunit RPC12/RpoP